jgi:sugar/nucleoside kinase (ribokinase family)
VKIVFIGDLSIDINVIKGKSETLYGGGVMHGAITAKRLGAHSSILTKCAEKDKANFSFIADTGVFVTFVPSETSTSIRNVYPTDNPDDRQSFLLSRITPFKEMDVASVRSDVIHINSLWFGAVPVELMPILRKKTRILAADAQGFIRQAAADGALVNRDFREKDRVLPLLDVFKVDSKEARMLTGEEDVRKAAKAVRDLGPKTVILTHKSGVCVYDGKAFYESAFRSYPMEGRTGRGDTCTAAFLFARDKMNMREATDFAADITSRKLQYRGAYKG